jgi:hypothetical protein
MSARPRSYIGRPLFELSRNPIDHFGRERRERALSAGWFDRAGLPALRRFAGRLERHPGVRTARLAVSARRSRDAIGAVGAVIHYAVQLRVGFRSGRALEGRGNSQALHGPAARRVALAESIERLAMDVHNLAGTEGVPLVVDREPGAGRINSNGASFHSSATQALKGAICELAERDALLARWYAGVALPVTEIAARHPLRAPALQLAEQGWELHEHVWVHDKVDAVCVTMALVRLRPLRDHWNFFLGGAARPSLRAARAKAFDESIRLFRSFHTAPWVVDTSCALRPSLLRTPLSRLVLYQRPRFIAKYRARLVRGADRVAEDAGRAVSDEAFVARALAQLPSLRIVRLPLPSPFAAHAYCIKAVCPELQDLDWEIPPRGNPDRLRALFGADATQLSRLPHPIA